MAEKDFYKVLGVSRGAAQDEIKRAYRKLARKYHPDVSAEKDADDRFKEVQEAYDVLGDPEKRAAYDQAGRQWQRAQAGHQDFDFNGGGFHSFFEDIFGGGFSGGGGFRQSQETSLALTLEEAARGSRQRISVRSLEPSSGGRLQPRAQEVEINVPPGVTDGEQLHVQAGDGLDLIVTIRLAPHPRFRVDGYNLYVDVPVTPWLAALGGKTKVPTLSGDVSLKVPAGAQSGQKLRLRGKGLNAQRGGDLYAVIRVNAPKASSADQRRAYEQLAAAFGEKV